MLRLWGRLYGAPDGAWLRPRSGPYYLIYSII